jgi:pyridoxamine 5'-phosphate oxidase
LAIVGTVPCPRMAAPREERSLDERDLDPDPHRQFQRWFEDAVAAGEAMPAAMAVATVGVDGLPRVRMMLLEDADARGFVFQTNLDSPKAADLAALPQAALAFFWPMLLRQVRVTGPVSALSRAEVAAYYARAPSAIQAMIRACQQSQVIADRATLERAFASALVANDPSVPAHWGGYRLAVDTIEFWQGRTNRLQDRLRYSRQPAGDWKIERLVP